MITKETTRLAIIGAGPSGLALSLFLKDKPEILESNTHVGGHASSFLCKGFTFDYGPHILFSRDQEILDFIVTSLGTNVSRCRRNNKVSYKGRLLNYPFENDLKSLDLADNYDCIRHFIFNGYKEKYLEPANMKEWFLKTFGEGICSRYLFPYNEKVWNIPVEQLSMSMASRIPNPPPEDILKSSLGYTTEGYLHQLYYHYPKRGGYQAICEAWKGVVPIHYQFRVDKIGFHEGKIRLCNQHGERREYDQVVSTMPIHDMIAKLDMPVPEAIQQAVDNLIVNPMIIISFALSGSDNNQYTAVYFPEEEFLVNRVSFPCTFSSQNSPEGHWSVQAEITCAPHSTTWKKSDAELLAHTREGLQQRKLLPGDEAIVFTKINRIERSYVVYDVGYEERIQTLRNWFAAKGIYLLGRFSNFEYINVDMAVDKAMKLAMVLNGEKSQDTQQLKRTYLQYALKQVGETS